MTGVFVAWNHNRRDSPGWIEDGSGCHIWVGVACNGYGRVREGNRMLTVTRVRYEREIGPIPEGMDLDHFACDNGPGGCCNPRHVRPVSRRENTLRGRTIVSDHAAKTHCPMGHELSGDNLVTAPSLAGRRNCRACKIARERKLRRKVVV